jgi:hypothetical protein
MEKWTELRPSEKATCLIICLRHKAPRAVARSHDFEHESLVGQDFVAPPLLIEANESSTVSASRRATTCSRPPK